MDRVLSLTTSLLSEDDGEAVIALYEAIDPRFRAFLLKSVFTYPEYQERLKYAKATAMREGKFRKYTPAHTYHFAWDRVDREMQEIKADMRGSFELFTNKLSQSSNVTLIDSFEYWRIGQHVRAYQIYKTPKNI